MENLWAVFSAVADRQAGLPALAFAARDVSFGELKALAEKSSAMLAESGVGAGSVVALQLPKRLEAYALLLGCLRLGALYVFIDPKNPPARARSIIDRVRPAMFVTTVDTDNPHGHAIRLSGDTKDIGGNAGRCPPPAHVSSSDPAYIMFTSGSTGEPKGAVIPHQGVLKLMAWAHRTVPGGEGQRFTNINPLHFDNSVFDVYCGLFNGATLVPIETGEQSNPAAWARIVREADARVMFAVPTLFLILDSLGLLTPEALPTVKTFLFGGEGYPIGRLREFQKRFRGRARLINVYGPTETSCICSSIEIDSNSLDVADGTFASLGRMHEAYSYAILDSENRAVEPGEVGELWIGGPCVGLGYYGSAQETEQRFVQDPRHNRYRSIYYRSGDLVREDAEQRLWFVGRTDNQVKIRGHRIELEEIDNTIQSLPGVRRAVAVALTVGGETELHVAFVGDRPIAKEDILAQCRAKLPSYMRPSRIVQFEELPVNANGKVDRLATKSLLLEKP